MSRYHRMINGKQELSNLIKKPINKAQKKRGFAEARLLTDWARIVGPALAQHCLPQKLSYPKGQHGATLHIICEPGWATELQFQTQMLCDRIATFFGHRAVGQIKIHQGPIPQGHKAPADARPMVEPPATLREKIDHVDDDELKAVLMRFGLSREAKEALAKKEEA